MHFMIIEKFKPGKVLEMYERFAKQGRMLPEGVQYVNSWINKDVTVCYQVMESETDLLLNQWIDKWKDLVDFEVIPVISSAEAKNKVFAGKQ